MLYEILEVKEMLNFRKALNNVCDWYT